MLVSAATSAHGYEGATGFASDPDTVYADVHHSGYMYAVVTERGQWQAIDYIPENLTDMSSTQCAPADPLLCFRPVEDNSLGVEISRDGGETWELDWKLSDFEKEFVVDNQPSWGDGEARTHAVLVLDGPEGLSVVAANGYDGFAVRDHDGEWERVGFTMVDELDYLRFVELPDGAVDKQHPAPFTLVVALALLVIALPVAAHVLPPRRKAEAWRFIVAAVLTAVAAGCVYVIYAIIRGQATYSVEPYFEWYHVFIGVGLVLALGSLLGATALLAQRKGYATLRATAIFGFTCAAAIAIDPLWSSADTRFSVGVLAFCLVFGLAAAGGMVLIARHRAREGSGTVPEARVS